MTNKERVLNMYPSADVYKHTNEDVLPDEYCICKCDFDIVTSLPKFSVLSRSRPYSDWCYSEEAAWESAWQTILEKTIQKLET